MTSQLEDGALYGHGSPRSHLRKAAVLLVLSALCIAAVPTVVFDILRIRGKTDEARATARDENRRARERVDGIVAATEDALLTVAMLREMAKVDGEVGLHARNTLAAIAAQSR